MPQGRRPKGPELVESLEGTQGAKERLRVSLETIAGTKSIAEACQELGVKPSMVHHLRSRALQAALEELEPKAMGRPRKGGVENGKEEELERQVRELRRSLLVAEVKADLRAAMPKLVEKVKESEKKKEGAPVETVKESSGGRTEGVKWPGRPVRRVLVAARGYRRQRARRELESAARKRTVERLRYGLLEGDKKATMAQELGLSPRTMRDWEQRERERALRPRRRGRPPRRSSVEARSALLKVIGEQGPGIGVKALRRLVPGLGREEVRDIVGRYRAHYLRRNAAMLEALEWTRAGVVWALDHTESDDGKKQTIVSVRDLSSGAQLLWKRQAGPRVLETVRDLERLFSLHGAPMVLKADNGSAFIAHKFRRLCRAWRVEILWSPPRTPRYNGTIEASIRWMKERTAHVATEAGRPGEWTREDLCRAQELTNQLPKDAERGGTPRWEVFSTRQRLVGKERKVFRERLKAERQAARLAAGAGPESELPRRQWAEIQRKAMRRVLVALGYLTITRRRVAPTLKSILAA